MTKCLFKIFTDDDAVSLANASTSEPKDEEEEEEWTVVDETREDLTHVESSTSVKAQTPEPVSRDIPIKVT